METSKTLGIREWLAKVLGPFANVAEYSDEYAAHRFRTMTAFYGAPMIAQWGGHGISQEWTSSEASGLLGDLFAEESPASDLAQAYWDAAAVQATFSMNSLYPLGGMEKANPKQTLNALLEHVELAVTAAGELPRWTLATDIRRERLKGLLAANKVNDALAANPDRPSDPLQKMLEAYLLKRPIPLQDQTLSELSATLRVSEWLKGIVEVPAAAEIQGRLAWETFLQPFRVLTDQFAGRHEEMDKLTDYVGVFEATTIMESAIRVGERLVNKTSRTPLLVLAPGGLGKSTLIAQFILTNTAAQYVRRFPFAYLDFDRAGLLAEEPVTLLLEVVRQFALQYPHSAVDATALRNKWSERLNRVGSESGVSRKTESDSPFERPLFRVRDREWFYSEFIAYVNTIQAPDGLVLLALDTFEEVQQRGKAFVDEIFGFLDALQDLLPGVRTVLAGRAPVSDHSVRRLVLGAFDPPAAEAFLRKEGVDNAELVAKVVEQVGGSPLTLKLAARLLRVESKAAGPKGIEGLETGLIDRIVGESIQVQLYKRILDHIGDREVRKLAHPGLILRRITPDLILKVLSGPCRVKVPDLRTAEALFRSLSKEISLVESGEPGVLLHRSDVRSLMLQFRDKADEKRARQVNENAIQYYAQLSDDQSRGEELYHLLLFGFDRSRIEPRVRSAALKFILTSIADLPDRSKAFVAARANYELPDEIWKKADLEDWELHAARSANDSLRLQKPDQALKALRERSARTPGSPLYGLEIEALLQSGNPEAALKAADALWAVAEKTGQSSLLPDAALGRLRAHVAANMPLPVQDMEEIAARLRASGLLQQVLDSAGDKLPAEFVEFTNRFIKRRLS